MAHELTHFRTTLLELSSLKLNASQALELQAFELLAKAADLHHSADAIRCQRLQLQAQTAQYPLAQAAALRALHWVQMRLRLHHAALDSLAKAAELYERCALPALAVQTRAARCRVMLSAEMHEELHAFCDDMLSRPETLTPAIHTMLLDYSASSSYYWRWRISIGPKRSRTGRPVPRAASGPQDVARTQAALAGMPGAAQSLHRLRHTRMPDACRHYLRQLRAIRLRRLLGTLAASASC
jgi:hypothetical protein